MGIAICIALTGFLNIACFIVGAQIGQKVSKGEKVEIPNLNPMKAVRENRARKEVAQEQDKLSKIMRNIERYDGTSRGQEDVG